MEPNKANAMDHVVLVLFENRSFDNLLGYLTGPDGVQVVDGVVGKVLTNPVPTGVEPVPAGEPGAPDLVTYAPAPDWRTPDPDPGEEHQHTNTQLFNILDAGNRGRRAHEMATTNAPAVGQVPTMDGFVTDYVSTFEALRGRPPTYAEYRQIMQGHTPDQVPVLSGLAQGFAVFDHWFSEVPSQTFPNRSFWTAGTSSGLVVNGPAKDFHSGNTAETLFDRLEAKGLDWKVYVLEPCPLSITGAIHTPRLKRWFHDHFVPFAEFERDVAAGTLPAFSMVEPNLLAGHADYHPPFGDAVVPGLDLPVDTGSSVVSGEHFLSRLYEAVRTAPTEGRSNVWNTALLVGWDEPGGTYDHVPPPAAVPPDGKVSANGFAFDRSGYRVPAVLVSPWVDEGTVATEEYRHTSLLATLRARWDLGEPFTRRDASAATFHHLFSRDRPRPPADWPRPGPPGGPEDLQQAATMEQSLSSLGRHMVHGMAHVARDHGVGHHDDPDAFDPACDANVVVPQAVFLGAARVFGDHFFTQLAPRRSRQVSRRAGAPDVQTSDLGHGLRLEWTYPSPDALGMTLVFGTRRLWSHTFRTDDTRRRHAVDLGLLRVELVVEGDLAEGTVEVRAGIDVRAWVDGPWRRVTRWDTRSVLRFDPCIGQVGGSTAVHPPAVDLPGYGASQDSTGFIMRIHVDDEVRELDRVGSMVKQRMFPPPYPGFVFNAVACVGAFEEDGPQRYGNPTSPWFNVFLGYYQIDCPKPAWDRPLGFASADGAASKVWVEDLMRLGTADWLYFSNWDYGVPEDVLHPYSAINYGPEDWEDHGLVRIGGKQWHQVELRGLVFASSYVSDAPKARQLVDNTVIGGICHQSYGYPDPQPGYPDSFIPQAMDGMLHMAYFEDADAFHTIIFGATAHAGKDRALLDAQAEACRKVIADDYAGFGFD